jgi:hypothetical protein
VLAPVLSTMWVTEFVVPPVRPIHPPGTRAIPPSGRAVRTPHKSCTRSPNDSGPSTFLENSLAHPSNRLDTFSNAGRRAGTGMSLFVCGNCVAVRAKHN